MTKITYPYSCINSGKANLLTIKSFELKTFTGILNPFLYFFNHRIII